MAFESKQSVSQSVSESVSEVGIELLGQLKTQQTKQTETASLSFASLFYTPIVLLGFHTD